jgi:hypothetical protein
MKISCMCTFKGTHARDFIVCFSHFFWHHSIKDKAMVQTFKNFLKMKCKILVHNRIFAISVLSPKTQHFTPLIRRNCVIPLLL